MKKIFLIFVWALMAVSCSQKVEVKGKIKNASPLDRVEIIDFTGVSTLPLINLPVNANGTFSGDFTAPKNGMYLISFARNSNTIFLKRGQTLNISGDATTFPQTYTITGEAKANNDFIADAQKAFDTYVSKVQLEELIMKDEKTFLQEFNKIHKTLDELIIRNGDKHKANGSAIRYKRLENKARLLGLLDLYEQNHGMLTSTPSFKVSKTFLEEKKKMLGNEEEMLKEYPMFREYQLNKLNTDFQKFLSNLPKKREENPLMAQLFSQFLKTRKDLSNTAKDYFLSYILSSGDINFTNYKNYDAITQIIENDIHSDEIQKDLKTLQKVLMGYKQGYTPNLKLENQTGKTVQLSNLKKGKPSLVVFYASWNPSISLTTIPLLKDLNTIYKGKINNIYINLDDTKAQFEKTSTALLKDFLGTHYWIKGGINGSEAKKFGLYGFRIPSYVLLNSDGKIYSRNFYNLEDPDLIQALEQLTGIKAPKVEAQLQPVFKP